MFSTPRNGSNCDKINAEGRLRRGRTNNFARQGIPEIKSEKERYRGSERKEKPLGDERKKKPGAFIAVQEGRDLRRPRWHVTSFKCGYMLQNNSPLSSGGPINCPDPGGDSLDPGPESARMQIRRPQCYRWELRLRYTCRGGNQTDDF